MQTAGKSNIGTKAIIRACSRHVNAIPPARNATRRREAVRFHLPEYIRRRKRTRWFSLVLLVDSVDLKRLRHASRHADATAIHLPCMSLPTRFVAAKEDTPLPVMDTTMSSAAKVSRHVSPLYRSPLTSVDRLIVPYPRPRRIPQPLTQPYTSYRTSSRRRIAYDGRWLHGKLAPSSPSFRRETVAMSRHLLRVERRISLRKPG